MLSNGIDRYTEMLENQQSELVDGLQDLYKLMQNGHRWTASLLNTSNNAVPSTNEILDYLRIMKTENPKTNLNPQHTRLITSRAAIREREDHCNGTSCAPSPFYELSLSESGLQKCSPTRDFPPTPDESPPLQSFQTVAQHETESYFHAVTQQTPAWVTSASVFPNGKQFISQYDAAEAENAVGFTQFAMQMDYGQVVPSMVSDSHVSHLPHCSMTSPRASSPEWQPEDSDYADSWNAVRSQDS